MKCGMCGCEFDADEAESGCAGCSLLGMGRRKVKCPDCGYETAIEPRFVAAVRRWWRKLRERTS